jgi:hypothetical protein
VIGRIEIGDELISLTGGVNRREARQDPELRSLMSGA